MTKEEIEEFFAEEFPHYDKIHIDQIGHRSAKIRHKISKTELRPGGTVAGPVLMLLADVVAYVAILGELGKVTLAVTTHLSINFLSKPYADCDLIAECELLKIGRTLVVGEVRLYSEGHEDPVAHCVATYAMPQKGRTETG